MADSTAGNRRHSHFVNMYRYMEKEIPQIIKDVGFDFSWDEKKVWQLDVSTVEMSIEELTWHFNIPFLGSNKGFYDLRPQEVIDHPEQYYEEYGRTMQSNTAYPIDIMFWKIRWLILDGLHRLMKRSIQGEQIVEVRKIPESAIPFIKK